MTKPRDPNQPRPVPPKLALTIVEFCEAHGISQALFYQLQKVGEGPRVMAVRGRRLISIEAAKAWREERTAV
jgi:hypothetical protein